MQKLIIKNFRQIPYAEIDITKFTIFIGPQASGKSTIAKLIYFFKSLKQDYLKLLVESEENQIKSLHTEYIKSIQEKFRVYFGSSFELDEKFELTYYFSVQDNLFLKLYRRVSLIVEFEPKYFSQIVSDTKNSSEKIKFLAQKQTKTNSRVAYQFYDSVKEKFLNELQVASNRVFHDDRDPIYFPAGRNLTVSYPEYFLILFFGEISGSVGESKIEKTDAKSIDLMLIKEFISYSKFLSDQFIGTSFNELKSSESRNKDVFDIFFEKATQIIKGNYNNADGTERISFGFNRIDSVKLSNASSGQQEVIRIIQDLHFIIKGNIAFRIYEEPEAHLFPEAQKHLIELMALMANKTDSQVVITTHSPYILTVINDLLYYSKVLESNPEAKEEIEERFGTDILKEANERINLFKDEVRVYSLAEKGKEYCEQVVDESGMISSNYLDKSSREIQADFDFLYSRHKVTFDL